MLALAACAGAPGPVRTMQDVLGDDHGPGTYLPPTGEPYSRGGFDLKALTLAVVGDDLVITAELARPVPIARSVRTTTEGAMDLFLPTVDVYLDLDLVAGSGEREGLVGRRVRLADEAGWEVALVLSPAPGLARRVLGAGRSDVVVAEGARARGATLSGRVPASVLRGRGLEQVGVAAAVTATVVSSTFRDLVPGAAATGLAREITAEPGQCGAWEELPDGTPCTFGGCAPCGEHPRVLDALHPQPGEQEQRLGRYVRGEVAELPIVLPPARAEVGLSRPKAPAVDRAEVVDRKGALVTARGEPARMAGLREGQLLDGLNAAGEVVATLMVLSSGPEGLAVLRVVSGGGAASGTAIVHVALP